MKMSVREKVTGCVRVNKYMCPPMLSTSAEEI